MTSASGRMRQRRLMIDNRSAQLTCAFLTLLVACAKPPSNYEVFVAPEEQVRDSLSRLVVAPVSIQTDVKVPDRVLVYLDSLIGSQLSAAGYAVVPAAIYDSLWTGIMDEAGGFFDPYTGERDDERFDAAVEELRSELRNRYDPDALVFPEIWSVEADVFYGAAMWDGVKQSAMGLGEYANALSLIVIVEGVDGEQLYVNGGGLEVAEAWVQGVGRVPLLRQQMFQDDQRLVRATEIALEPLTRGRGKS